MKEILLARLVNIFPFDLFEQFWRLVSDFDRDALIDPVSEFVVRFWYAAVRVAATFCGKPVRSAWTTIRVVATPNAQRPQFDLLFTIVICCWAH